MWVYQLFSAPMIGCTRPAKTFTAVIGSRGRNTQLYGRSRAWVVRATFCQHDIIHCPHLLSPRWDGWNGTAKYRKTIPNRQDLWTLHNGILPAAQTHKADARGVANTVQNNGRVWAWGFNNKEDPITTAAENKPVVTTLRDTKWWLSSGEFFVSAKQLSLVTVTRVGICIIMVS